MTKQTPFPNIANPASESLQFASGSSTRLPHALLAQIDAVVAAVEGHRDALEKEIQSAEKTALPGVKSISRSSASVSLGQLQNSWSPKTYLPVLQVEDLLQKMRSGLQGDATALREVVEWSKKNDGSAPPLGLHATVAQKVAPTLAEWIELNDAMAKLKSPGVGTPAKRKPRA